MDGYVFARNANEKSHMRFHARIQSKNMGRGDGISFLLALKFLKKKIIFRLSCIIGKIVISGFEEL